eukprot:1151907-Pelagomonas_calceolata.AAC.1
MQARPVNQKCRPCKQGCPCRHTKRSPAAAVRWVCLPANIASCPYLPCTPATALRSEACTPPLSAVQGKDTSLFDSEGRACEKANQLRGALSGGGQSVGGDADDPTEFRAFSDGMRKSCSCPDMLRVYGV